MRIESWIYYWDEGFLTFNPEKIRGVFFEHFQEAIFEKTNFARSHLERFLQNVKEKKLETPEFIIDKYWELAFQNGPVFKFDIPLENDLKIKVTMSRYRVSFDSDSEFSEEIENKVIEFLKLLKNGCIRSNQQTKNFVKPCNDYKDSWKLKEER